MKNSQNCSSPSEPKNNKALIFETAIRLFAQKGYNQVSMRDIAKEVGIKASSIYNHYQSKNEILESIFDYFVKQLETVFYSEFTPDFTGKDFSLKEFLCRNLQVSMELMETPFIGDITKIITKEQFNNERIRNFLLEEMIQKPRVQFEQLFSDLIAAGKIKSFDPKLLAREYQAFSVYQFYQNSMLINERPINIAEDRREQEAHIEFFIEAILAKKGH